MPSILCSPLIHTIETANEYKINRTECSVMIDSLTFIHSLFIIGAKKERKILIKSQFRMVCVCARIQQSTLHQISSSSALSIYSFSVLIDPYPIFHFNVRSCIRQQHSKHSALEAEQSEYSIHICMLHQTIVTIVSLSFQFTPEYKRIKPLQTVISFNFFFFLPFVLYNSRCVTSHK